MLNSKNSGRKIQARWSSEIEDWMEEWMDGLREITSFMEGKRRSVEVNKRDESCQTKLNESEHRNHLS